MAVKANKGKNEAFITYVVVKPHDGLKKGEEVVRKAGTPEAEYCVSLGLWKEKKSSKE
jgi:hypothetical protein